jgi:Ca-activated chloride channel family protein
MLKVPFAPAATNAAVIKLALADSHARGVTPIAFALEQAVADFGENSLGHTIVLVSDGGEDCNGDPCATAAMLHSEGFVINTVGFGTDVQGGRQLQCIARASGGQYFPVPVAVQLQDKLMQALGICPIALGPTRRLDGGELG